MLKKTIIVKILQILMLIIMLKMSLLANDIQNLSNTFWQRSFQNSCTESFTFNNDSNTFTFVSSFGKKMIGYYTLEKIRNLERLKIIFEVKIDNGLSDCVSQKYNTTNQIIVNYLWLVENEKKLNIAVKKEDNIFNTYAYVESYSSDRLMLLQTYIAQIAVSEIQKVQSSPVVNTVQQQIADIEKKQREKGLALNIKIMEQLKANKVKSKNGKLKNNNTSWKEYLTPEQWKKQQEFENKLDEQKQSHSEEIHRNEDIYNDSLQESYIQDEINQDYSNGY